MRAVLDAELEGHGPGRDRAGIVPFDEAYGEDYASAPGGDPTAPLVMVRPRAPRRMDAVVRSSMSASHLVSIGATFFRTWCTPDYPMAERFPATKSWPKSCRCFTPAI